MQVNMQDAKIHFPELIEAVRKGEIIYISQAGAPVAKLEPVQPFKRGIRLGLMKNEILIAEDFDAPLPEDVLRDFEGMPPA